MRSRTGCQTCRQRKLKCDEEKPTCGQCRRGSRDCRPSDGVVFRHQQNASMNGEGVEETKRSTGRLGSFYAYKDTFNEHNVWVDVPKNVTFYNITDPFTMDTSPEPESRDPLIPLAVSAPGEKRSGAFPHVILDDAPGLEALSAAATSNYDYMRPSNAAHSPGDSMISPPSSNKLNFILNPAVPEGHLGAGSATPIDPALASSPNTYADPGDSKSFSDHEVAFLLRHFSETAGQWMDLYDLGCYFAHLVPVRALSNPLLKYSACAYAAKQLGRVRGRKAINGGNASRQADMELSPHSENADWAYVGAKYYDKAIQLLMGELSNSRGQERSETPGSADTFTSQSASHSPRSVPSAAGSKTRRVARQGQGSNADETVAAGAILCVYEFLDNANIAWSRHLSGTKSLFDMAESEAMLPIQSPTTPGSISKRVKPSRARKAAFWNFARQDFLAAFINEGQTRLNTEDLGLWRAAGLHIDDQGFVMPSNTEDLDYPDRRMVMREDMVGNALIWLISKVINFIASGDSIDHVYPQNRAGPNGIIGINHMLLLERWRELEIELDVWYQGLPDAFKPCARLPPVLDGGVPMDSPRAVFSEVWYSIPICASTMQSYYMARIILLINKPHESTARRSTLATRLHSYRSIESEVLHHSHEICGIALGRPEGSVRIQQVQPLFVAGQCLTDSRERHVVIDLLRGVEEDLGWATDYRVKQLLKEWKWEEGQT